MSRSRLFLAAFIAMISLADALYAQYPGLDSLLALRPRNLEAKFMDGSVQLRWRSPEANVDPAFYKIYRSTGYHLPNLLASTPDTTYHDTTVVTRTEYRYAVTAVYQDTIESLPSNFVKVFTGEGDDDDDEEEDEVRIKFTSHPPRYAIVSQAFTYDAEVMTSPSGIPVCFRLKEGPDGMTIDGASGVISWTPKRSGSVEVEIEARTCDTLEGRAKQEFRLFVFSGIPGLVVGTVHNDSGAGLPHVTVKLFDVARGEFVLKTTTNDSGRYEFPVVNPTTYLVRAKPEYRRYLPQWYDGAERIADATPVVVPESGAVTIDFTLHTRDSDRDRFRLEGIVLDDSSRPVKWAKVFASRLGHDRWSDDRYDDCHDGDRHDGDDHDGDDHDGDDHDGDDHDGDDHDGDHDDGDHDGEDHDGDDNMRTAVTDSNGHYFFVLREGTYIVGAFAKHYLPQFWDHKSSPLEADPIHLVSDTSGIDFDLHRRVVAAGSISGHVFFAADSTPAESHVIAFRMDSTGQFKRYLSVARTNDAGAYALEHLPDGSYIVLAKDEEDIVPTFYNLSGGTPFLDSATTVTVSGGGAVTGIDIYAQVDSVDGLNSIGGKVSLNTSAPAGAVPLAGVIITLTGVNGKVTGSAISQGDGTYLAVGLAPGTYTVVFQKPGISTARIQAAVQYQNNLPTTATVNVRLSESPGEITLGSGPVATPKKFMLYANYPNPFNPTTKIAFDLPVAATVTLKVYNVIGQEVATLADNVKYEEGRHTLVFDASGLGSGLYFTRLQAGSYSGVRKMVLVR